MQEHDTVSAGILGLATEFTWPLVGKTSSASNTCRCVIFLWSMSSYQSFILVISSPSISWYVTSGHQDRWQKVCRSTGHIHILTLKEDLKRCFSESQCFLFKDLGNVLISPDIRWAPWFCRDKHSLGGNRITQKGRNHFVRFLCDFEAVHVSETQFADVSRQV